MDIETQKKKLTKIKNVVLRHMDDKKRDKWFIDETFSTEILNRLSDEVLEEDNFEKTYFYSENNKFEVFFVEGTRLHHYVFTKHGEKDIEFNFYKYNKEPFLVALGSENKEGFITYKDLVLYYDRELKTKVEIKNGDYSNSFLNFVKNF